MRLVSYGDTLGSRSEKHAKAPSEGLGFRSEVRTKVSSGELGKEADVLPTITPAEAPHSRNHIKSLQTQDISPEDVPFDRGFKGVSKGLSSQPHNYEGLIGEVITSKAWNSKERASVKDPKVCKAIMIRKHLSAELARPKEANHALEKANHSRCKKYNKYKAERETLVLEKERLENKLFEILAASKQDKESFAKEDFEGLVQKFLKSGEFTQAPASVFSLKIAPSLWGRYGTTTLEEVMSLPESLLLPKVAPSLRGRYGITSSEEVMSLLESLLLLKVAPSLWGRYGITAPEEAGSANPPHALPVSSHLVAYTCERKGGYSRPSAAKSISKGHSRTSQFQKRSKEPLSPILKGPDTSGGERTTPEKEACNSHSFHQKDGFARWSTS
ncbi:hypothetical protein Tco_0091836 [Tanacetum coccineum]